MFPFSASLAYFYARVSRHVLRKLSLKTCDNSPFTKLLLISTIFSLKHSLQSCNSIMDFLRIKFCGRLKMPMWGEWEIKRKNDSLGLYCIQTKVHKVTHLDSYWKHHPNVMMKIPIVTTLTAGDTEEVYCIYVLLVLEMRLTNRKCVGGPLLSVTVWQVMMDYYY